MNQSYCVNQICVEANQQGTYDCTIPSSTLTAGNCISEPAQYISNVQSLISSDSQHRLLAHICCSVHGCSFSDEAINQCTTTDSSYACVVGVIVNQAYVSCRDLFYGETSNFCTFSFPSSWTPPQCNISPSAASATGSAVSNPTSASVSPGSASTSGSGPSSSSSPSPSGDIDSDLPITAIAGGTVGALAVIVTVGVLIYRSRRAKFAQILDESANHPPNQLTNQFVNPPQPYSQYHASDSFRQDLGHTYPLSTYTPANGSGYTPNGATASVPSQNIPLMPVQSVADIPQPPKDIYIPHQVHATGAPAISTSATHASRIIITTANSGKDGLRDGAETASVPYDGYSNTPIAANSGFGSNLAYASVGKSASTKLEMLDPNPPAYTR